MTPGDHEEILRRALRAAADSIEPAADGLQRIRAGLRRPHVAALAWLVVGYTSVAQPVLGRLRDALGRLREALGRLREATVLLGMAVARRLVPRQIAGPLGRLRGWVRGLFPAPGGHARRYASLQTALAVGGVVLVAAVLGVVLAGLPQKLTATGATSSAGPGGQHAVHSGRAGTTGSGKQLKTPNPTPAQQGSQGNTPGVSLTCPPSASASPSPTNSPTASITPPATPSPTSSTSGSPTPTASTTPSATSSPAAGSTSGTQGTGTGSTPGGTTDAMGTGPFIGLAAGLAPSTPSPTAPSSPSPALSEPPSSPSPCPSGSG